MRWIIATRGSQLALYQATFVQNLLREKFPDDQWEIQTFKTTGDKIQNRPLSEFGGKGAFLKEIEEALLEGAAHLAVHSLKDVPAVETPGLRLCAFLPREDPRDVWVSNQEDLMHLAPGKTVGTSSLRRSTLLSFYRPDLPVEMLRGNLDTRLKKLQEGKYDAIVLAAAGLHRLNLFDDSCMQYLNEEGFIPAIGQGVMVVQTKDSSADLSLMLEQLNDPLTRTAATIERSFLARYQGGCHLPIGGFATWKEQKWSFRAFIGGVRSHRLIQDSLEDENPQNCSTLMYQKLEDQGARELLAELTQL